MELILGMLIFVGTDLLILYHIDKHMENPHLYDTTFCRDARAQLDMFVYASQVEEWREALDRPSSKF